MRYWSSITSFLILGVMTVYLFVVSFLTAFKSGFHLMGFFMLLVLFLLIYQLKNEWQDNICNQKRTFLTPSYSWADCADFLAVITGTLVAFILSHQFGFGPIVASSTVGIAANLFFNKYEIPAFCGSFVGMACSTIFFTCFHISLAGAIAGMLFIASKPCYNGLGGKLGTIAFFGTWSATLLMGIPLQQGLSLPNTSAPIIVIYSIIGALVTFLLKEKGKLSAVLCSGSVGFFGGVILPYIYPNSGSTLAIIMFCASFAGMSSVARLPGEKYLAIAGLISAIFFFFSFPHFGGSGGKLGAIAFGSTIAVVGYIDLSNKFQNKYFNKDQL